MVTTQTLILIYPYAYRPFILLTLLPQMVLKGENTTVSLEATFRYLLNNHSLSKVFFFLGVCTIIMLVFYINNTST